jgi:hypothetical protein
VIPARVTARVARRLPTATASLIGWVRASSQIRPTTKML